MQGKMKKRYIGTMLTFHIALETQVVRDYELLLLWKMNTQNEYFHTKHNFHMASEPCICHFVEWKPNQNQYVYSLHPLEAGRFCKFWSFLCPQPSWGHSFLWVTLYKAWIDHVSAGMWAVRLKIRNAIATLPISPKVSQKDLCPRRRLEIDTTETQTRPHCVYLA